MSDAPTVSLETIRDALQAAIVEIGFAHLVPNGRPLRAVIYTNPVRGGTGVTFEGEVPCDRVEEFERKIAPAIERFPGQWMYPFIKLPVSEHGSTDFVAMGP